MTDIRSTDFVAPAGGVMTDEVGAVTGELTLRSERDEAGVITHRVQYKDADEWYAPTGLTAPTDGDLDAAHAAALAAVTTAAGAA